MTPGEIVAADLVQITALLAERGMRMKRASLVGRLSCSTARHRGTRTSCWSSEMARLELLTPKVSFETKNGTARAARRSVCLQISRVNRYCGGAFSGQGGAGPRPQEHLPLAAVAA